MKVDPAPRVLLYSGGLDSMALWVLLDRPPCLYVMLGHKYQTAELRTIEAQTFLPTLRAVDGPPIGSTEQADGHIAHRNLVLATVAAAHGYRTINYGALRGEASPDKSRRFVRAATRALTASEHQAVRLVAPAARYTKTQLLRRALEVEPNVRRWAWETRSCYAETGECGECQACFRRAVALFHNGIQEYPPDRPVWWSASTARRNLARMTPGQMLGSAQSNMEAVAALRGWRLYR